MRTLLCLALRHQVSKADTDKTQISDVIRRLSAMLHTLLMVSSDSATLSTAGYDGVSLGL